MCDCQGKNALRLAERKSRGRVPGYTPSSYNRPGSFYARDRLSDLFYERESLYPTQFDYEYNYTYPYASFPYTYPQHNSLFMPQWF